MKIGVVLFNDTCLHEEGWACRAGEDPFRITGTHQLSTDTLWIMNIPYGLINEVGMDRNSFYRQNDFLWRKIPDIACMIGIAEDDHIGQAKVCADIASRVIRIAQKTLGFSHYPMPNLKKGIRELLGAADPFMIANTAKALKDSTKNFTTCQRVGGKIESRATFTIPALYHAQRILTPPVPCGNWHHVTTKALPRDKAGIEDWVMNSDSPSVVRVVVNNFDSELAPLLNYGTDLGFSKFNRQWITSTELITILGMAADVQLQEAYVCEGYTSIAGPLKETVEGYPEETALSFSWQIFLGNLWTAFSTAHAPAEYKRHGKHWSNPVAPFVRAQDRLTCFESASTLHQAGLDVLSFGTGTITVDATNLTDEALVAAAQAANLIPPLCHLADMKGSDDWNDTLCVLQTLYGTGNTDLILQLDEQVVTDLILEDAA